MKLVKRLGCLLISAMFVATVTGCGEEPDYSVANIQAAGLLKVAVPDTDSALFYYDEEAEDYRGTEAEVIDIIAQALGVITEFYPMSSDSMAAAVLSGSCDLAIGHLRATDFKETGVAISKSYGGEKLYMVTPRGVYAGRLDIFANKAVGVSAGLSQEAFNELVYVSGISLSTFNDSDTVVGALSYGNIQGYVCYESEALYILENGDFQMQSTPGLLEEAYSIIADPIKVNLIIGTNSKIDDYLNGTRKASWITEESSES